VTRPTLIVLCNALDDATRKRRRITTDSPAASRKVFMLCEALRLAGVRPYVLSLGRGKADGSVTTFRTSVRRVRGIPVVYAPFSHVPIVSELLTLVGPIFAVWRLSRRRRKAIVYYNRMTAYLPTLAVAAALRYRNILDLEDGEVAKAGAGRVARAVACVFDWLCRGGALLACTALSRMTRTRPVLCYYGIATAGAPAPRWNGPHVTLLMSGTIAPDTGADMLARAIRVLRADAPEWAHDITLEVTGKGPSLDAFRALAGEPGAPRVVVHGRTTDAEYAEILARCDAGLALKPIGGELADTTFPSKVIEFAGAGLLVVTTDISDVREVLGAGAFYLTRNDEQELLSLLRRVAEDRLVARDTAVAGTRAVRDRCSPLLAGQAVSAFVFGKNP
jgi:glycosyltransferase involved in cell wall biosynthesis